MGRIIRMQLPMPPSTNRLYRKFGHQVILTKEARAYHEIVKKNVTKMLPQLIDFPVDLETQYRFDIILWLDNVENPGWFETFTKGAQVGERKAKERYKRIDIDNRVKFLQDCFIKALGIPNDSQVFIGSQAKFKTPGNETFVDVGVKAVGPLDTQNWLQYLDRVYQDCEVQNA
jgi:Holliday junction resolvase RusA-like endonuclease